MVRENGVSLVRTIVESISAPENKFVYWYDVTNDVFKRYENGEWKEFNINVRSNINSLYSGLNSEIESRRETDTNLLSLINKESKRATERENLIEQSIPDISGKADRGDSYTKKESDEKYLTEIPEEYITETELDNKGYLTEHQDISGKADKTDLENEANRAVNRENEIENKIPDISNKVDKEDLDSEIKRATSEENSIKETINNINSDLDKKADKGDSYTKEESNTLFQPKGNYLTEIPDYYITEDELDAKGYLTEHQDISGKADKSDLEGEITRATQKESEIEASIPDAYTKTESDDRFINVDEIGYITMEMIGALEF